MEIIMNLSDYNHSVEPFDHQRKHLEEKYGAKAWGLFWEQGTAKTKPIIDTASILFMEGKINGLVVIAPPGVERNWKSDELPKHLPVDVSLDVRAEVFYTAKMHNKAHQSVMKALLHHDGLAVLLMNYSSVMTKVGKKTLWDFLQKRRCLYVLDESHNIKSPGAKRTRTIIASGKYAHYRRVLTGTPISKSPFDVYSQVRFLDDDFWKRRGIQGSTEFRAYFGEWRMAEEVKRELGYDPGYDQLIAYKNLDELSTYLSVITDRVLKEDVLDLPPKLYAKRYVEMTKEQRVVYDGLINEWSYEFASGQIIDAELAIVRLLRLQQVLCNYIPTDKDEPDIIIGPSNPRLGAIEDIRDECHTQGIIWARFTKDVEQLCDLLGKRACRYDGTVDEDQAERNKLGFQAGEYDWFVGTAQKGGPGLTLTQAKRMVYYSNSFRLIDRLQSEDRAHRAGMDDRPVDYTDLIVPGTVDEGIVTNLREKREVSATVLKDAIREWI